MLATGSKPHSCKIWTYLDAGTYLSMRNFLDAFEVPFQCTDLQKVCHLQKMGHLLDFSTFKSSKMSFLKQILVLCVSEGHRTAHGFRCISPHLGIRIFGL